MLLAAGHGSRLSPLTEERAKPAVPFANRPMAMTALESLVAVGATEIAVNTHHLADTVEKALRQNAPSSVRWRFFHEEELLGTGGGVARAAPWLREPGESVVVMNSDILYRPDLRGALRAHAQSGALATMVLREDARAEHFGAVWAEGRNVRGIDGTCAPRPASANPSRGSGSASRLRPLVFTGVHVLSTDALARLPVKGCIVREGYARWLGAHTPIGAFFDGSAWNDLGTLQRYLDAHVRAAGGGDPTVAASASVHPAAALHHTWVGEGASVGPVTLERCVVWDGARVDEDAADTVFTKHHRVPVTPCGGKP